MALLRRATSSFDFSRTSRVLDFKDIASKPRNFLVVGPPTALSVESLATDRFIRLNKPQRQEVRNRYVRLSADFPVCDADATPRLVIEIDDRSHQRQAQQRRDRKKDEVCKAAGIEVIRWPASRLPKAEEMRTVIYRCLNLMPPERTPSRLVQR